MSTADLTMLERITIQMEYAVPLIRDLQKVLGEEVVTAALAQRIKDQTEEAKKSGAVLDDLSDMAPGVETYAAGDALDYDIVRADKDHFDMNVTGCRYAKMMEKMGAQDIGHHLICGIDYPMAEQMGTTLKRTQTCMQGATHCDFRYSRRESE